MIKEASYRENGTENSQQYLQRVIYFLSKQELVETTTHKQDVVELKKLLDKIHSADIAYILEALPLKDRLTVWNLVKAERDGEILLETSEAVRETLIANMDAVNW